MPGKPYVAKWPDEFGNLKTRDVLRPDIIGRFFSSSNVIDVGNQLRQHDLALEKYWHTKDPWFRIDTTVIGITVIDSYLAAKYQAPSRSAVHNMSVKDFALHTVYDLWNRDWSSEPRSMVEVAVTPTQPTVSVDGVEVQFNARPLTRDQIMLEHQIKYTDQRGKSHQLVRRKCEIKAKGCHGKGCTTECQHEACKAKSIPKRNRNECGVGTFICMNMNCHLNHWNDVLALSK